MSQPITLHFTPQKQDYATVLRLFFWQRTGTKISLAILVIAFGLVLAMLLTKGSPPTIFEVVWLLLPPFFLIFIFLVQPARMASQAAENEQLAADATWEVSDAGVRVSNRFGSSFYGWESLAKLITSRDYYLLLSKTNKNTFRFLPRRAFTSPEEQDEFEDLVESHLNKN